MNSSFTLDINALQSPPAPFASAAQVRRRITQQFADGELDAIYGYDDAIGPDGSIVVDLYYDNDRFGAPLQAAECEMLLVENVDDGTGEGVIEVRPYTGEDIPWDSLLGAGSSVALPIGTQMVVGSFSHSLAVNSENSELRIVESTGDFPTRLRVQAWIRR